MAKKAAKKDVKKIAPKANLKSISKKLDAILKEQKKLEKGQESIKKEEHKLEEKEEQELKKEEKVEELEEKEVSELEKLERMEQEIKQRVAPHPLKRITIKDIARGSVGALFGAVAHYTFIYGLKVAEEITFNRAIFLFIFSFLIGAVFLYATGFRKIKDPKILIFLPVRLIVLYITSLVMATLVLAFFQPAFGHSFEESFKQVSAVTLTAIIGACTADLIGKE
ncbi:DUF2391 family protein [Candidatus Woesearchaeota archaeon]|nr:DUF2391 family protein [Candidatus Woesearchaeota archaeon]